MNKIIILLALALAFTFGCKEKKKGNAITEISETALVIYSQEPKPASEMTDDDYAIADDELWYLYKTTSDFEKVGVKSMDVKTRYVSFKIDGADNYLLDFETKEHPLAVLYKKGKMPIDIFLSYQDPAKMAEYLGIKQSDYEAMLAAEP